MEPKIKVTPADKYISKPINKFISKSTTGGILLFIAAIIAIFFANSEWKDAYDHFWHQHLAISLGNLKLDLSLHHWINDGLMAIFFFVVGLELKRELSNGELASPKKAMLPIIAAIGGMIFPALIYMFFNNGTEAAQGWGIPMATDIAFALGVMYLLGSKVPAPLKIFLTALAIVDDLGAVLVIAIFYTNELHIEYLCLGIGVFGLLLIANKLGVKSILFYALLGIFGIWLPFLMSGVHATIAAVLIAFAIPANARVNERYFVYKMKELYTKFVSLDPQEQKPELTDKQIKTVEDMRSLAKEAIPASQRLEHSMHNFVSFIVMPIFALCNAAIPISFEGGISVVTIGVALGLILGKVLGVFGLIGALIGLKIVKKPTYLSMKNLLGVAFLASIGFTMSLFITDLAFDVNQTPIYPIQAKMGIVIASLIGGVIGFLILNSNKEKTEI